MDLIERYGADGVRMGMMLSAPAGMIFYLMIHFANRDVNFNNKIWNAFRLVKGWEVADIEQPEYAQLATKWFDSLLVKVSAEIERFVQQIPSERSTDGGVQTVLGRILKLVSRND